MEEGEMQVEELSGGDVDGGSVEVMRWWVGLRRLEERCGSRSTAMTASTSATSLSQTSAPGFASLVSTRAVFWPNSLSAVTRLSSSCLHGILSSQFKLQQSLFCSFCIFAFHKEA